MSTCFCPGQPLPEVRRNTLENLGAGVKMRETASCTTEKCKWLMPSHVKKIPAARVAMIDFSSAKSKKKKLDNAIAGRTGMDANMRQLPESSMKDCKVCTTRASPVRILERHRMDVSRAPVMELASVR
ncbi:unnamed protein product [Gadus morhua 'NCC']